MGTALRATPELDAARRTLSQRLAGSPWVAGIGFTWTRTGKPCLLVNIAASSPASARDQIPRTVSGIPVRVDRVEEAIFQ